jgi:hypothetical protein
MRMYILAAVAAGLAAAAPAGAADLDKYLPEDTGLYIHIGTKNFLTAPVVRKAIPMAFDKYGDQIIPLIGLAKQFNPQAPDVPEEQIKQGINELKKPETIATAFDAAKDFAPELVIAGSADAPDRVLVLVKASDQLTPEMVDGFAGLAGQTGQLKLNKTKAGRATVYEINVPQQPQAIFATVPEAGVLIFGVSKEAIEAAAKAGGDAKIDAGLKDLIAKRDAAKDFVFFAGAKGKGDGRETFVGSLVLDRDISGRMRGTFATPEEAKQKADELNQNLAKMVGGLKDALGDKAQDLKGQLDSMKATVSGKTVNFEGKLPGTVVEKLLAKE